MNRSKTLHKIRTHYAKMGGEYYLLTLWRDYCLSDREITERINAEMEQEFRPKTISGLLTALRQSAGLKRGYKHGKQ